MVSREMMPCSPWLLIFFQSEKYSQVAVRLPILLMLPLERITMLLYQNNWGISFR